MFLDFDGVLNSLDWIKRRPSKEEFEALHGSLEYDQTHQRWALRSIDPAAVLRLERLVSTTKSSVVVSSSWRTMYALNRLEGFLRYFGFTHHLLGCTPDGFDIRSAQGLAERVTRGQEIAGWLRNLCGDDYDALRENIVILDDEADAAPYTDRLIQTNYDWGLTDADVDEAIAMFRV